MQVASAVAFFLLMLSAASAQEPAGGSVSIFRRPYQSPPVPQNRYEDSGRINSLMRAGQIYLSLQDAIALAIENNLDIAVQRYGPVFAKADELRAQSGALIRGFPLTVREGPVGVSGPASPVLTGQIDNTNNQVDTNLGITSTIGLGGTQVSPGSQVPVFDPFLVGQAGWGHRTVPQTSQFVTGTDSLVTEATTLNAGYLQGFSPGTQLNFAFNNSHQSQNSGRIDYNPYTNSSLGFTITQPLLQGFGIALNKRFIRIAKNNEKIADLTFQQQLIATASGVIRLYYDLVSVNEDVKVKRQALEFSQKLLDDNQAQVEVGTLAPIEVVRAQAEVARSKQALTNSESLVLQQEVILKNYLSRRGTVDPALRAARIVPTDSIRIPDQEPEHPVQELLDEAVRSRPDLTQARLQLDSAQISLQGTRNALLPQLNLIGTVQNNAMSGDLNSIPPPGTDPGVPFVRNASPYFVGGYGTALSHLVRRNFPDYAFLFQLNIPLSNRQARADLMRDRALFNQSQMRLEQLNHQARTDVEAAVIALQRARADYDAARQTIVLQEQALEAEQEKYKVGASTSFFVIQYERDLAQARSDAVLAASLYAKAQTALERALGLTLANHGINIDEAYQGALQMPPSALPPAGTK